MYNFFSHPCSYKTDPRVSLPKRPYKRPLWQYGGLEYLTTLEAPLWTWASQLVDRASRTFIFLPTPLSSIFRDTFSKWKLYLIYNNLSIYQGGEKMRKKDATSFGSIK